MRIRALAATLGVATSIGVGVSVAPAHADGCPSTYLCAFGSENYGGSPAKVQQNNKDLTGYWKFRYVKSLWNSGKQCTAYLYGGRNYSGVKHTLSVNEGYPNLNAIPEYRSTGVQSNRWCHT
ncbi:hypothetical protein FHS39_004585 [Streptomyces olivoverticillatus]|uniref:Peptidase inhibitor family I36 n=1 Tax=Streptomyces olivoverticillatus TaxID=66427 RepID=A0A7W7LSZ8_9ACTN|nr:peptidase inhibitor family I36 protein [Streptomyces olivoverticillatus]MBB4895507.1 hypothetical protein [Streptomyces olivoverticillatus]